MMHSNNNNMTPMTPPRLNNKRAAPATPTGSAVAAVKRRRVQTTPGRRRRQPQPVTPKRRSMLACPLVTPLPRSTAVTTPTRPSTGDRFIPNRARTDVSRVRHALRHNSDDDDNNNNGSSVYKSQLQRVLFGNDNDADNNNDSLMSFGPSQPVSHTKTTIDPNQHDVLRSAAATMQSSNRSRRHHSGEKINIRFKNALDAPEMLLNPHLTLIASNHDTLAVALQDRVYLWQQNGSIEMLEDVEGGACCACVRFSHDGQLLAVGQEECFQVFDLAAMGNRGGCLAYERFHHDGFVTALAFGPPGNNDNSEDGGLQFVAAGDDGIKRCDLSRRNAVPATYGNGDSVEVTALEWTGTSIAACSPAKDMIEIFDAQQTGHNIPARHTLHHKGLRSIEFCPLQPNLLASAGDGGVKLWNVWDGSLRGEIKTSSRGAVGTLFSKMRYELVVAEADKLAVYSISSRVCKLVEIQTDVDKGEIINMKAGPNGTVACTTKEEIVLLYSLERSLTKQKLKLLDKEAKFGAMKLAVMR